MSRHQHFWKQWLSHASLSVFVASLMNVNKEYLLWPWSISVCTIMAAILFNVTFTETQMDSDDTRENKDENGCLQCFAEKLSKKILCRAVTFPWLAHNTFCNRATDHSIDLLPDYTCMCIPGVHEWPWDMRFWWKKIVSEIMLKCSSETHTTTNRQIKLDGSI